MTDSNAKADPNPHRSLGRGMGLLASLLLLGGLWLMFGRVIDARDNPNRHLVTAPGESLLLKRGSHGHYIFPGEINGRPVTFLLDTGATLVSVPARLGEELNLQAGAYQNSITANGTVSTRATRIARLAFGPFVVNDVPASLNPGMQDDHVLLGMSVLKHLEFTQRGDILELRTAGD
ncbi:MAG: aspartyl protease [Hydrogenophilales bacterium 16-64-46]|nr:MAG: aspartyl protease [Hydrogenophilales bacterium 12-64-13]OYZ06264.1 MAG: aspartyl protease [Hydrogenophilales bacterium 16-64-46]OZA38837.1 MAG: aspartyl protease [Hydrogenophilales bacterium 17-64-34]HQS99526.1 TIGR02281 family clan AA aspartic protease [Thiobacillus sp.]